MPSSARSFGISSTSAGGPQTKHSVAGSWTSSPSRRGRSGRAGRSSRCRSRARHRLAQLDLARVAPARATPSRTRTRPASARCRTARCCGAAACSAWRSIARSGAMPVPPAMNTNGARRGAAGNVNVPSGPSTSTELPGFEREVRPGRAVGVDADQQLEPAVAPRVLGRRGDRIRPPLLAAVRRDRAPPGRRVVERLAVEIEPRRCARAASPEAPRGWAASARTADYAIARMALRSRSRRAPPARPPPRLAIGRRPRARRARGVGRVQRPLRRVVDRRAGLVVGATGLAIVWTGLTGARAGLGSTD